MTTDSITTPLFVPSYHRADSLKTLRLAKKYNWAPDKIWVFIDSEADDKAEYEETCSRYGCHLVVFDIDEARERYDYIFSPSKARRSVGQARNMFQDFAKQNGIEFYCVQDDDSLRLETKPLGIGKVSCGAHKTTQSELYNVIAGIEEMMRKRHIGLFGLPQTGDMFAVTTRLMLWKVMNFSFYLLPYIYRGERGEQDEDTAMYAGLLNEGYFTGSMASGITLKQSPSAVAKGGLTELYQTNKLLQKSLICAIQFPGAIHGEKQVMNGGRLHHRIGYRYLRPCLLRAREGERDNIAWDTFSEDVPFTNEPKREVTI